MNAKLILSATLLLYTITAGAQNNNGTVNYETTIALGNLGMENVPAEIAAMLPKETSQKNVLYFNAKHSLYESIRQEDKKPDYSSASDNTNIKISISNTQQEERTYVDISNKKIIEEKELMGKKFLIIDQLQKEKWKMTGRQKMLLNYPLQEAMAINGKDTTIVWFTSEIPVATGPMGIAGLPGLVLEASVGSGLVVKATAVKLNENADAKITEPTKGKKVSAEQFKKIAEEKAKEMAQEYEGKGSMIKVISR